MLVNRFDGGLNTRVEPQFLQVNEATRYVNIDNASKVLRPVKGTTEVELAVNNYPYWYPEGNKWLFASGQYLPRARLAGKVYEGTAVGLRVYSQTSDRLAGVAPPAAAPAVFGQGAPGKIASATLTPSPSGDIINLPQTSYTYLFLNRNASGYSQGLSVIVKPTGVSSVRSSNYFRKTAEGLFIQDYEIAVGVDTENYQTVKVGPVNANIAGSYGVDVFRLYNGEHRLVGTLTDSTSSFVDSVYDISANTLLDNTNFSNLLGVYQYVITRVNADGVESAPSPVSAEVDMSAGGNILLTFASYSVTGGKIRVYRIGGTLTSFSLVEEIPGASVSYLDNIADVDIEGSILTSQSNTVAPTVMTSLVAAYAMLFAAVGSSLRYTNPGEPEYWPASYSIPFPATITGLAPIANGLLVMTAAETYLVSGTGPLVLSVQILSGDQGCLDPKSVQVFKDNAIWATADGIAVSSGSGVALLSKDKLGRLLLGTIRSSVMFDEVYYLSYNNNKIIAIDFSFGQPIFKEFSFSVVGAEATATFFRDANTLYLYSAARKYKLFDSGTEAFSYTSPRFIEGKATENKLYKKFYFYVEGAVTISILLDDEVVATKTLPAGTKDSVVLQVPQELQRAFFVQFQISGTGTVFEYEYVATSRANA